MHITRTTLSGSITATGRALFLTTAALFALGGCDGCVEVAGECQEDADCSVDELCVDGACLLTCISDLECTQREQCRDGLCVPRPLGGDPTTTPDASADDLGAVDSAVAPDAAMPDTALPDMAAPDTLQLDTSLPDTSLPDTSLPDTSLPDTGLPDTSLPDAWQPDAWQPDAWQPDAWQPDAWQPDTNLPDSNRPDAAPPCTCLDARDTCDGQRCERADYTCNALNLCDEGYGCDNGVCVCEDRSVCGLACVDDSDCPAAPMVCETRGFCNDRLPCIESDMCGSGEICSTSSWPYPACYAAGAGEMGDDCATDEDCATGICYTRVCLEGCAVNTDCPPQLACAAVDSRPDVMRLACVAATDCGTCGSGQFCDVNTCRDGCRSGADCGAGETCYFTVQSDLDMFGYCIPADLCGDEELYAARHFGQACVLREACWSDDDCDQGGSYSCLTDLDSPATTGLCGRVVVFPDASSPDVGSYDLSSPDFGAPEDGGIWDAGAHDRTMTDLPFSDSYTPPVDGGTEDGGAVEDAFVGDVS